MKLMMDALMMSLNDILKVVLVILLVWLIFAIFGITLYKNKLGYCEFNMNFHVGKT